MTNTHPSAAARAVRLRAALLAALLAVTAGFVAAGPSPVAAAEPEPTGPGLTWKMSDNAFTGGGLSGTHDMGAPATKTGNGFSFPEATEVRVSPLTGEVTATFPGSFDLGNTNRGNYRIRIADPILTVGAARSSGTVSAEVSWALTPVPPSAPHSWSTPVRTTVATLAFPAGSITDTGSNLSFTVTPTFAARTDLDPNPDGWRQFPQGFIDTLDSSLRDHFRETGSGTDGTKAPSPLTVSLDYSPAPLPTGLTWPMSGQAWASTSMAPAHSTADPADKLQDGFNFPTTLSAAFDPETGIGQIDFPGAFDLGNTNQGNYRIRIANPSLLLDGDGTGSLTAEVAYALAPSEGQSHFFTDPARVTVADLTFPDDAISLDGDQLSFTVTPDFALRTDTGDDNPNGYRQFPQAFLSTLSNQLISHFRETGVNQPAKAPSPLHVDVTVDLPLSDHEQYVVRLFGIVLGRSIGDTDLAYWVGRLEGGASHRSVANAVAQSVEARQRIVDLSYQQVLGRRADAEGRVYWADRIRSGLSPERLRAHLITSPEAVTRAGGTDLGVAASLYPVHFGYAGDTEGIAFWAGRMGGTTAGRHATTLAFGRTSGVTAHLLHTGGEAICGRSLSDEDPLAEIKASWTGTGRNQLRLAATILALACPDEGPLPE